MDWEDEHVCDGRCFCCSSHVTTLKNKIRYRYIVVSFGFILLYSIVPVQHIVEVPITGTVPKKLSVGNEENVAIQ